MQGKRKDYNCIVTDLPELEPIWGVISLLSGEKVHTLITELYGVEQINSWKRRYHFLFEAFQVIEKYKYMNIMDFLLNMPLEQLSLSSFRDILLAMPAEEFLWKLLELDRVPGAKKEVLEQAFTEDAALNEVYDWISEDCESYLVVSAFIRQSRKFISEFFLLAAELRTKELEKVLMNQKEKTERLMEEICAGVEAQGALAFSEEKLGKTFRNRGPYEEFIFLPTYLMPAKACRYFHTETEKKRQILFLTLREMKRSSEETVTALKTISDGTRYQILSLLAKEGPMRGVDIAKKVSLATSTVSHHMEQLKGSGMITEEQVKSAKYYGVNKQSARALLDDLKRDLCISK